jgi:Protein of unknown function (DUF998)
MSTSTTARTSAAVASSASRTLGEWPPRIAVGGAAGFALAAVVSSFVQPDTYDSVRDTISVLAAKDAAAPGIMMAGFTMLSVGLIGTAVGLWRAGRYLSARIGSVFVLIAGFAVGVAGFARIECNPAVGDCLSRLEASQSTTMHGRAALLTFAPLLLAGLFLAWSTFRGHLPRAAAVRVTAVAAAILNVVLVFTVEEGNTTVAGLLQRILLFTLAGLPIGLLWLRRSA